jgi:hypothetical protein
MEVLPNHTTQEESTLKPWIDPHQLKQHQGIWYKDSQQVVTGDMEAKRHLIQSHHDTPIHGHPGISKTIQLVERLYWWPRMRIDITEYVKGCADCQRHKVNTRPTKAPLQPIYPKQEATPFVTDLQGPPSERTQSDKIRDLKSLTKQYARDQGSCDDTRISYLEYVESEAEADWTLARMIAG